MVNPDSTIPEWLKREYPFKPQLMRTPAGARMSYVDVGPQATEAVLLLHGNPTWSYYYRGVVRVLQNRFRCIAPDHIGMGLSDKPQDYRYTLEQRILDVEALVDFLRLKRVHLVLHDWGGAIGLGWAGRHPNKVGRITLLNTGAFRSTRIPARIGLCKNHPIGTLLVRGLNGFAWPATWMSVKRRSLTPEQKLAYLFPYGSWHDRVAVNAFVKDIPMAVEHPSRGTLESVEANLVKLRENQIQLVWGGKDFCFNRSFHDRFLQILPRASSHYLASAGHYVLEDAAEECERLIKGFLL